MRQILVATHNKNKTEEFRNKANGRFEVIDLTDIGYFEEIAETGTTLEDNALLKAKFVNETLGYDCIADDTGLEIECLDGAPGVYSARYAGPEKDSENNMAKVLELMKGCSNRKARFRTVIALVTNGESHLFEGVVNGTILNSPQGTMGFGYDPIFLPDGGEVSFAEMNLNEKNKISHRARAFENFYQYIALQSK